MENTFTEEEMCKFLSEKIGIYFLDMNSVVVDTQKVFNEFLAERKREKDLKANLIKTDEKMIILKDLLRYEKEIISSPIRFNGVSVEHIRQVFARYGTIEDIKF
jgi:hypothetical protein